MKDELVSIIVPVYNVQNYLERCLESILSQTYEKLEIILIDDGSADRSGKICDKYAKLDQRVRVVHQVNRGLSAARNTGIRLSNGEYIALVDSDDFIEEKFIQTMYDVMQESNSDMVCCEFLCFMDGRENDVAGYWKRRCETKAGYEIYESTYMTEMAFYQKISVTGAQQKLYRKSLFENIMFPEGRYFEDLATAYQFFFRANQVAVIDRKLYAYRIRSDGIMNENFHERKLDCVWVAEKLVKDMKGQCSQLGRAAACAAFRVNRLVFHQIPAVEKSAEELVWKEIQKYRQTVVLDKKAQSYERLLALTSYGGKGVFVFFLLLFKKIREFKIRYGVR